MTDKYNNLIMLDPSTEILSHDQLKKLFIQKMIAIEKRDLTFIDELRLHHPELFDKQFLYKMLLKELENTDTELPTVVHNLLLEAIQKKYRIQ